MIAVGGCTHALNIIDGMNGLAGMIATLMALSLALVALQVQDIPIFLIAASLASATLGFLVWNFSFFGRVFSGDGGAYFLGFMLAELAVQLVVRNPVCRRFTPWPCCFTLFLKPCFRSGVAVSNAVCLWISRTRCTCINWCSVVWCVPRSVVTVAEPCPHFVMP